eukprot:464761-Prymnesium_polylepis.1
MGCSCHSAMGHTLSPQCMALPQEVAPDPAPYPQADRPSPLYPQSAEHSLLTCGSAARLRCRPVHSTA